MAYQRAGSISYSGVQTALGDGSLQAVDWEYWSTRAAQIQAVRAAGGEVLQYIEPPRLTPNLGGYTGRLFNKPDGEPYDLSGWTHAAWYYKGNQLRPRTGYAGSYAADLSARFGETGTAWMQHVVACCCIMANTPGWKLDGFFLDSTGNDSVASAFTGWQAGEQADFHEGNCILVRMLRAALGPDCVLVSNNFWNGNGTGPNAAATVNGICNEHHDDNPVTSFLATAYARCTNPKRRILYIAGPAQCSGANASVGTPVTHTCIGQPASPYTMASNPGTCAAVQNGAWPPEAGHIHMMDSLSWGADPGGANPSGDTTPPQSVTSFSAGPAVGTSVPYTYGLPTDPDRVGLVIARRSTAWPSGAGPSAGVTVATIAPAPSGSGSGTATATPAGTWFFKAFPVDAAGNYNTAGSAVSVTVVPSGDTTPPAAPTAFTVGVPSGSSLPYSRTLPTDSDRASFRIYRRSTAWPVGALPDAGTLVTTETPGAPGAGSGTMAGLPDGVWHFKAFTFDAAGNVNVNGQTRGPVTIDASSGPAVTYRDEQFAGAAGLKPEASVWADPDPTASGLQSGLLRTNGAGELRATVKAAAAGVFGGVVAQTRDRLSWSSDRPARALLVTMGGAGEASGSTSFYLVPKSGAQSGSGLSWASLFPYPDWLRFEHIDGDFRILRRGQGTLATLYSGAAPSGLYEVWLLIDTDRLVVQVDGDEVLDLTPWVDVFTTPFDEAYLYLEAATDGAATGWEARFGAVRFMRATPAEPTDPTFLVDVGSTTYTAPVPPADELVELWRFLIDDAEVAEGATRELVGDELDAGTYLLGLEVENASPFVEA